MTKTITQMPNVLYLVIIRSRSSSRSPDPPMLKSKRNLDLVSTRRLSPPSHSQYHQRGFRGGRGRSSRRPFIHRGGRGAPFYRGSSHPQKYYPRYQRYSSRSEHSFISGYNAINSYCTAYMYTSQSPGPLL